MQAHEMQAPHQEIVPPQLQLQDLATTATLFAPPPPSGVLAQDPFVRAAPNSVEASIDLDEDDSVGDGRRNWSHEVALRLVNIWKRVCQEYPEIGRVARMEMVYEQFKDAVDCAHRSRKAVEDKLYTLKQMYQFIIKVNGSLSKPSRRAGTPTWFQLTKDERRAVRSLHRVRVPNISLAVFHVIDSVLNPKPILTDLPSHPLVLNANRTQEGVHVAMPSSADASEIVDNKRNWSEEVTLQLAKAWYIAHDSARDLRGAMLSQRVYNEFIQVVGGCSRSRKAIEDKMHSMKEMYRFIRMHDANCLPGSNKPLWFELSKAERRQLRNLHKIRVPNMSQEVYAELDRFLKQQPDFSGSCASSPTTPTSVQGASFVQQTPVACAPIAQQSIAQDIAIIRRLAEEENELVPLLFAQPIASSDSRPQSVPQPTSCAQGEDVSSPGASYESSAKRPRWMRADNLPATSEQIRQLLRLQESAIAERRAQHAEQMAMLHTILQRLEERPV